MKALSELGLEPFEQSLDEFVETVNVYLPQVLPETNTDARVKDTITPRLIRYLATQGMMDEPTKSGRYVIYKYRHLLQVLVSRRLTAEGYAGNIVAPLVTTKSNRDLEALLKGGAQLELTVANPALAYLYGLKGEVPPVDDPSERRSRSERRQFPLESAWTRVEIMPGCELHVREGFAVPRTGQEEKQFLDVVVQLIDTLRKKR
jgi:DNA-binding transcriptional MerR regulator